MNLVIRSLAAAVALAALVNGHMEMTDPPPLGSTFNPNTDEAFKDYNMRSPMNITGNDFPCRKHHEFMGTPRGKPVASWIPGQSYSMTIAGSADHKGGSCQASVSLDRGKSFKVIQSYIGNCPPPGESKYDFTLPSDVPSGEMLFAWSWLNNMGNREMYMNCAVIDVKAGGKKRAAPSVPLAERPDMFVANVGNGVCTYEGTDVEFPEPGPDTKMTSDKPAPPGNGGCNIFGGPSGGSAPKKPTPPENPTPQGPATPQKPTAPRKPTTPQNPTTPDKPTTPQKPTTPDKPTTPQRPYPPPKPSRPQQPTRPQVPDDFPSGNPNSGSDDGDDGSWDPERWGGDDGDDGSWDPSRWGGGNWNPKKWGSQNWERRRA
ncbi:extracellular protein [Drechmeria coniospora]|uniref:Extracellular protein n=1 Tax=Drechmeria coniospora TaxID=98403 RepID=A0A151GW65_DRECN|nr:extracellular protein [Drechmeria coniospora]KYK61272.1 extracellular protein [Drechmeria coniospora]